jgi:hypothetical protein
MYNTTQVAEEKFPRTQSEVVELDLSFIKDSWCADMLRDGMNAIVLAQGDPEINAKGIDVWNYLSTYEPPSGEGFMFSRGDMVVSRVQSNMQTGHSGNSMAFTMRHIQLLAKIGISKYRDGYNK